MKSLLKAGLVISCVCLIALMLTACGGKTSGGDTSKVEIKTVKSELYSQEDIDEAVKMTIDDFGNSPEFSDCTLTEVYYDGNDNDKDFAKRHNADQSIYIGFNFKAGERADKMFSGLSNPRWCYLVRSHGENWQIVGTGTSV